jgi:hypothetical protein
MEVLSETDWYVSFPLNLDIEELKEWAHGVMKEQGQGSPTVTGEHDDGVWWMAPTPPKLKTRLEEYCELNDEWTIISEEEWLGGVKVQLFLWIPLWFFFVSWMFSHHAQRFCPTP